MPGNMKMRAFLAMLGPGFCALIPATIADAANPESVTVTMSFIDPVTITEVDPLRFGLLDVAMASNDTIIIAPDSSVTDSQSNIVGGIQGAANLTVTAEASMAITILVDNVSGANGYSLGTWMCNYNSAGSDSACDGSGYSETSAASATLLIGATLTGNGSASAGPDDSSFDVTVTYQ